MAMPLTQRSVSGAMSGLLALLLSACTSGAAPAQAPAQSGATAPAALKLATWNLEWLIAPREFKTLTASCVPRGARPRGRARSIPCDVATDLNRSQSDYAALARYARQLDADVVALQEVDGESAARLVFPDHEFCFTARRAVQNTGFAIRRGLPYRCGRDLTALALDGSVRRGAELIVFPDEARELRLLSVHLKSGCGSRALDDPRRDCQTLARQVPELERWIDAQAAAGRRFAVLGDFNRQLLSERGPARNAAGRLRNLWAEIDDGDPPEADLHNVASGQPFRNCSPDQSFRGYIDHIVVSKSLLAQLVPGSFERLTFEPSEALRRLLPDHCPVAIKFSLR